MDIKKTGELLLSLRKEKRLTQKQAGEVYLPRQRRGELYFCCSEHGLFRKKI